MSEKNNGTQSGSHGGSEGAQRNDSAGRILDDFSKFLTDAAGVAQGAKREVESAFRGQAERVMDHLDVVQRDEFEAVKEMAARARTEASELRLELDALKMQLEMLVKKPATKKPAAKKAASKKEDPKA